MGDRSVFPAEMKYYDVAHMTSKFPDPYRHNTFGNLLDSPDLSLQDGALTGTGKSFDIRIHALTKQTPATSTWIETIERQAAQPSAAHRDWAAHCRWWSDFWNRSWIIVSDNTLPPEQREKLKGEAPSGRRAEEDGGALVAQSYNVFRFLMACQSSGPIQAKFNGGLFTQPLRGGLRPLALNFANGVHPGGGFLGGARAQEEVLCRSSALYRTLVDDPMYEHHRGRQRPDSTDWAIYSPDFPVFRKDDGTELDHP